MPEQHLSSLKGVTASQQVDKKWQKCGQAFDVAVSRLAQVSRPQGLPFWFLCLFKLPKSKNNYLLWSNCQSSELFICHKLLKDLKAAVWLGSRLEDVSHSTLNREQLPRSKRTHKLTWSKPQARAFTELYTFTFHILYQSFICWRDENTSQRLVANW